MAKSTSLKQYDAMVSYMESHPDLATGYVNTSIARQKSKNLWEHLINQLNCLGPATRNVDGWKKVWADYKQNIKRKISRNKTNMFQTGGGPIKKIKLTDTERKVNELLNLKTAVYGSKNTKNFGVNLPKNNEDSFTNPRKNINNEVLQVYDELGLSSEEIIEQLNESNKNEEIYITNEYIPVNNDIGETSVNFTKNLQKTKNKSMESKENALKQQIELQKSFYEKITSSLQENIAINSSILKATQDLVDLKKEKLKKTEMYRQEKLKLRHEELRGKRRKLEIEEEKLKIQPKRYRQS